MHVLRLEANRFSTTHLLMEYKVLFTGD